MADATYTNDPANKPIDRIRLEIGDTDCSTAYLTDAEIRLSLASSTAPYTEDQLLTAAADSARRIAAKLARRIDFRHGPVSKSLSQAFDHYRALADELIAKAAIVGAVPIALGVEVSEKEAANADTSRVQPAFSRGMMDNPEAGNANAPPPDPA